HGIGIPDAEKGRIFDKFYRVGSEDTRNTKGTGLGLYIVKQVLDKHEATIKVKDNKPAGSVFEVVFG
ncbi:MAG: two-component sensor histidine kinase, partial [Sphingobacteriaceae bacterium]